MLYALLLSVLVLRTLSLKELPPLLLRTGIAASAILLAIGTAAVFGWVATLSGIPNKLAQAIFAFSDNPLLLLFLVNVLLLIVGMFLDAGPAILILGPILAPTMLQLGIEPVHFAIIMCVNLTIGLATPPMGLILFVASTISQERIEAISKELLPYFVVHLAIIFLIKYVPALSSPCRACSASSADLGAPDPAARPVVGVDAKSAGTGRRSPDLVPPADCCRPQR